jgi:hypothetical protein
MEEEYRMQKAQNVMRPTGTTSNTVIHEDGSVVDSGIVADSKDPDDDASTKAINEPSSTRQSGDCKPGDEEEEVVPGMDIPTIKITSDSARNSLGNPEEVEAANGEKKVNGDVPIQEVEKPQQAAANEDGQKSSDSAMPSPTPDGFSFTNKRLCERWLDNLFMVLYEVRASVFALQ